MSNETPPPGMPTPPNRPPALDLGPLASLRAEFARQFSRHQDEVNARFTGLQQEVEALQLSFRQRERYSNSLEAMLGRLADTLTVLGASIEKTEQNSEAILEVLRTNEGAAAVLEALRRQP